MQKLFTVRHLPTHARFGYTRGNAVMGFREWQHAVSIKRLAYLAPLMQQQDHHIYYIPLQVPDYCMLRPISPHALTIDGHRLLQAQRYYALHNVDCLIVEHMYQDVAKDRLVFITYNPEDAPDYNPEAHPPSQRQQPPHAQSRYFSDLLKHTPPPPSWDLRSHDTANMAEQTQKQKQISTRDRIKQLNRLWHGRRI